MLASFCGSKPATTGSQNASTTTPPIAEFGTVLVNFAGRSIQIINRPAKPLQFFTVRLLIRGADHLRCRSLFRVNFVVLNFDSLSEDLNFARQHLKPLMHRFRVERRVFFSGKQLLRLISDC